MGRAFLFFVGIFLAICIFTASPIPAWLIWVLLFGVFFSFLSIQKNSLEQPNFQSQVHKKDEYEHLCDLYREAFAHNDFDALQALAKEFACGGAADYWQNNVDAKQKIAQGVKELAEVVESGNAPRKPELEDFYYVGLMYEQGFECEPDLEKALSYFEKALDTQTCWSHQEEDNELLRAQVNKKLREINSFLLQRQMHKDKN